MVHILLSDDIISLHKLQRILLWRNVREKYQVSYAFFTSPWSIASILGNRDNYPHLYYPFLALSPQWHPTPWYIFSKDTFLISRAIIPVTSLANLLEFDINKNRLWHYAGLVDFQLAVQMKPTTNLILEDLYRYRLLLLQMSPYFIHFQIRTSLLYFFLFVG